MQGLRIRHDDQLRRIGGRHSVAERLHIGQSGAAGQLQDEQHKEQRQLRWVGRMGAANERGLAQRTVLYPFRDTESKKKKRQETK